MRRQAVLSDDPDALYRYLLTRIWGKGPRLLWIMLNPSTADGLIDDATIKIIVGFSRRLQFDGAAVVNLFAFRSTFPHVMKAAADPIGPENNKYILAALREHPMAIAAWGVDGDYLNRDKQVMALARGVGRKLHALEITRNGYPRHPLRIPYTREPLVWKEAA